MQCPRCQENSLRSVPDKRHSPVEVCASCGGIWVPGGDVSQIDPDFLAHRSDILHMVEGGFGSTELPAALKTLREAIDAEGAYPDEAVARLSAAIADGNMRCHLATMARLGVSFDLLPHESDILHLGFWKRAFELLKSNGAIRLETTGKNAGCWVMSLASSPEFADMDDRS